MVDWLLVLFSSLREYFEVIYNVSLRSYSIYTCKSSFFACYFLSSYCSYLYTYIAYERWQAVKNPIKYKQNNQHSKRNIQKLIFLCLFCLLICLPIIFFVKLDKLEYSYGLICKTSREFFSIFTILDALLYSLMPFLATFAYSLATLIKLVRKRKPFLSNLYKNTATETDTKLNKIIGNSNLIIKDSKKNKTIKSLKILLSSNNIANELSFRRDNDSENYSKQNFRIITDETQIPSLRMKRASNFKMSIMLLTLPFTYLICHFPFFVIVILNILSNFTDFLDAKNYEKEFALSKILMFAFNSFNIIFFILFGPTFRKELKECLRLNKRLIYRNENKNGIKEKVEICD